MTSIQKMNLLSESELQTLVLGCCGSRKWARQLVFLRPYHDFADLMEKSNFVWYQLQEEDWLEAFSKHPKIGDIESLRQKYSNHDEWSKEEQSSIHQAQTKVLEELKIKNETYHEKNGFIFIVFATDKTASEMLNILSNRLKNGRQEELEIASREQNKITRLRLEKLVDE